MEICIYIYNLFFYKIFHIILLLLLQEHVKIINIHKVKQFAGYIPSHVYILIQETQFVLILSCPFPSIDCLRLALARDLRENFLLILLPVWQTKMSTPPPELMWANIYFRIFMKLAQKRNKMQKPENRRVASRLIKLNLAPSRSPRVNTMTDRHQQPVQFKIL